MKQFFRRKPISDKAQKQPALERKLTAVHLLMFGVGAIIGAGLFVMTGEAAAKYAGPAVVLSFFLSALVCICPAFCFAELSTLIPSSGGAYAYVYAILGELAAWTIGWGLCLEYLFAIATVSVGFSGYFCAMLNDLGLLLPLELTQAPLAYTSQQGWSLTGFWLNAPAMILIACIGTLVSVGVDIAAKINNAMVVIKFAVIGLFLLSGIPHISPQNWVPFIPPNLGSFGEMGFSGVLRGAAVTFFAFIGFDALATLAPETKNVQKNLPLGMVGSLCLSTLTYMIVALVLTGLVHYSDLGGAAPFSVAINALGPSFVWLRLVSKLGIIAGLVSVVLVMLMGQTRIFLAISQDRLLPAVFRKIHPKLHTPVLNTLIVTGLGIMLAGFLPTNILGELLSMGALLSFTIVCLCVLVLGYREPDLERPFRAPGFPFIPIIGASICIFQMCMLSSITWIQLFVWMSIGYLFYFSYGYKHSLLKNK